MINEKAIKSANYIWPIYLLIMLDTLLLRPSLHFTPLHFTPLHYACRHFTSSHLIFTKLHCTTLWFGIYLKKFRLKILFYFLTGYYVVKSLVTRVVLRSLKWINIVKMTPPLDIPEDSNLLGCCMVLPGNWCSTFLEDHHSSCDSMSLERKTLLSIESSVII